MDAVAFVGGKIRQPSTIFRTSKLGIPDFTSDFTLVLSSLCHSDGKHVKRLSLPKGSKELYKREKNQAFNSSNYEGKKNDNQTGGRSTVEQISQFPPHR